MRKRGFAVIASAAIVMSCGEPPPVPKIDAKWFDLGVPVPCTEPLLVRVDTVPGARVEIGGQVAYSSERIPGPASLELRPEVVNGRSELTAVISKNERERKVAFPVPPRTPKIVGKLLMDPPQPKTVVRTHAGWVLTFDACNVVGAEGAKGTVQISARRLQWTLDRASVNELPVSSSSEFTIPLPLLTLHGPRGRTVTAAPVVTQATVLDAIAASFPAMPLDAAPTYAPGRPLFVVGDELRVVRARPAARFGDVSAVAIVRHHSETLEDCRYSGASGVATRSRSRVDSMVSIHQARTGQLIDSTTLRGPAPPPCANAIYRGDILAAPLNEAATAVAAGAIADPLAFSGAPPDIIRWLRRF